METYHEGPYRCSRVSNLDCHPDARSTRERGPGEVRGSDIQTTADVEILNPDLYLATVNAGGRLAMDLTVEQGRGYLSAERNKRTSTIGAASSSRRPAVLTIRLIRLRSSSSVRPATISRSRGSGPKK